VSGHTNLPIGAEFHGYRIDGLIGQGGMGVVYRAFDLRLKRTIALKLMAPELGREPAFRERFARESQLAMSLEHPNVVPIHDAGEANGVLYLAMRDVEGTDLRTLLRTEGALPPARALAIVRQVAAALDAAHAKGLVHRDVKPSNVLLDANEHAYLADFGLTRRFAEESGPATDSHSLGTPAYLAPEQIEGGAVDGRADVYALACLLFECLTGNAPFSSGSQLGVAWAHLEEEPPRASERNGALPVAIDGVIAKGMAKRPSDRYQTCGELVGTAGAALGIDAGRSRRRHAAYLGVAAAAVAGGSVVAALIVGGGAGARPAPVVRANTLVRIDPEKNEVAAVIGVGEQPFETAVSGRTVWVYNADSRTVSEVDSETNTVRHVTNVSSIPLSRDPVVGPVLAADDKGAWLIGLHLKELSFLITRVFRDGRGKVEHRISTTPIGVAVGGDSLWILGGRDESNVLLRLDPRTWRVTKTIRLGTYNATSLAVGDGRVWVASSKGAGLYRIDAQSGRVTGHRALGECAGQPRVGFGSVWMCVCNPGSSMLRIDPDTLRDRLARNAVPAQNGMFSLGYGGVWWHDFPSGTIMRWTPASGDLAATIRITPTAPAPKGPSLHTTSIAVGAGAVWVTVADV
jgi:tRNA A-37 threonylcarbamoyl transferase component Bud32/DNA-binding beta-propeller fold protein YncE